jgi:prefoldin subunit 5
MEGICNLQDDRLNRLEKAIDQQSGQIEKTKNTLNEIKEKLAAWTVYLAIGAGLFIVVGTYLVNNAMESIKKSIDQSKQATVKSE